MYKLFRKQDFRLRVHIKQTKNKIKLKTEICMPEIKKSGIYEIECNSCDEKYIEVQGAIRILRQ